LASIVSIVATYVALRLSLHSAIAREALAARIERPALAKGGRIAAAAIAATAVALLVFSALGAPLGVATFACGTIAAIAIFIINRQPPWPVLRHISWGILPLVAGLFVLVKALAHTGVIAALHGGLADVVAHSRSAAVWLAGIVPAVACNLMNNLPVGLIAGSVMAADHVPQQVTAAALIGVDLGPNLSVTGSLATILWLTALRREGESVAAWRFLRLGVVVMLPALILSVASLFLLA